MPAYCRGRLICSRTKSYELWLKIAILDLLLELNSVSVVFHSNSPQHWRKDELYYQMLKWTFTFICKVLFSGLESESHQIWLGDYEYYDLIAGQKKITFKKNHSHFSRFSESRCTTTLKRKATRWILAKDFFSTYSGTTPKQQSTFDNSSVSRLPAVKQETFQLPTTKVYWWSFTDRANKGTSHRAISPSPSPPQHLFLLLASICQGQAALISKRLFEWTYLTFKQVK